MSEKLTPQGNMPPDTLTQKTSVLTRREIEARILAPVIEALGERFGREAVVELVKKVVVNIAREQGKQLARAIGGTGSREFADSLQFWTEDDALNIDILEQSEERLHFNVSRCRYAEMYRALGIPELGSLFSCNRDFALVDGFNDQATLQRTQTIMEGASHCDFRYRFPTKQASTPKSG